VPDALIFPPTRADALDQLTRFAPAAGRAYAEGRNFDPGPEQDGTVSRLSPYLRRRMISEAEVIAAARRASGDDGADKFIQEVLWRTYWKGWLEMRPSVWSGFLETCKRQRDDLSDHGALADAEAGRTGVEGFDDWARELARTGYLHNHTRMWFASIWIFTLRLPWALGADFFLRHLLDADPASNTLSWRWVAGLHTPGKTYLATRENIARFTGGRFAPNGLAREAVALPDAPPPLPKPPPPAAQRPPPGSFVLLVTPEDLDPEPGLLDENQTLAVVVADDPGLSSGDRAFRFTQGAARDAVERLASRLEVPVGLLPDLSAESLAAAARSAGLKRIVTPYAPVGPTATALARLAPALAQEGLEIVQVRRAWDDRLWPHARAGFFAFQKAIPALPGVEAGG